MPPTPSISEARARILAVAADLFYREGFRVVGVDRIVAESGVAKMTFYRHFPSKDDLLVAVLEHRRQQWHEWLAERIEAHRAEGAGALSAIFDALEEWVGMPGFRGCPFANTCAELADPNHPGHAVGVAHIEALMMRLEAAVRADGGSPAEPAAREILLLINGALLCAALSESAEPIHWARRAAQRLVQP